MPTLYMPLRLTVPAFPEELSWRASDQVCLSQKDPTLSPLHTLCSQILTALGQDSSEDCLCSPYAPCPGTYNKLAKPQLHQRSHGSSPFSILLISLPCQSFLQSTPSMNLPHQITVSYPASRKTNLRHLVIKIKINNTHTQGLYNNKKIVVVKTPNFGVKHLPAMQET